MAFALTLKTLYPTHSSVLVKLGQEYVYQPRSGDAGRGAVPDNDQMVQSEAEIMGSDAVKMRVVGRLGVAPPRAGRRQGLRRRPRRRRAS